ncbi:AraC family transcriptional regulator [Nocardioides sp. NPDC059952]|uniref:AraC family transcriptional regulator n=1 Tax=Nocardioides sp. NPDC059952 TaxID=3347014 RepID=UPI00365E89ED
MSLVRASGLAEFRELVRELGADPDPLLRRVGVRAADAGDHDVFITYRSLVEAIESAASLTATPDFGRRLAKRQGVAILGPLAVAARTAPTVGDALRICTVYLSAYSPSVAVALLEGSGPDQTFLEFRVVAPDIPACPQVIELSLGIAAAMLRYLRGDDYRPHAVHLPHAPVTAESSYRDYYGCAPHFAKRRAGFMLATADLARGVSHEAQAHAVILRYLDGMTAAAESDLSGPVRRLVRQLLPTGAVTMDLVARQFSMHRKTLQRRLAAEGTTFGALLDETRRELADHYLRNTDLSLTQVARELGYAEQSVLSRSCVRWYGEGPAARRARLREVSATVKAMSTSVKT